MASSSIARGLNFLRDVPFSSGLSTSDQENLQDVLQDYFTATNNANDSDTDYNDDSDMEIESKTKHRT